MRLVGGYPMDKPKVVLTQKPYMFIQKLKSSRFEIQKLESICNFFCGFVISDSFEK